MTGPGTTRGATRPQHERDRQRPVILYVVKEFPQISQTYIKSEIEALRDDYDIVVLARRSPDLTYRNHHDFRHVDGLDEAKEIVEDLRPDMVHTHYLNQMAFAGDLATHAGVPFTVRSHSFDTLALRRKTLRGYLKERVRAALERSTTLARSPEFRRGLEHMRGERCLGVLAFPFARPWLEDAGLAADKVVDCFPSIAIGRFEDRGPNGAAVMNTGVATPKKRMEDFNQLSTMVPSRDFRLYGMGYQIDRLREDAARRGASVEFVPPVEPDDMPAEYKRHQWLVYTADFDLATVGWPMAVAEAQAAGVGVCMPRIRPDLEEYVGAGAGFLYDSLDEVASIIRSPVPDEVREAGFEQAKRSDIARHRHLLTDLWAPTLRHTAGTPGPGGARR